MQWQTNYSLLHQFVSDTRRTSHLLYIVNRSRWKSFVAVEMKCNLLENIHSCMAVLCGQTLLHRGIITISLEKFCGFVVFHENHKTFLPWAICNIWYLLESYRKRLLIVASVSSLHHRVQISLVSSSSSMLQRWVTISGYNHMRSHACNYKYNRYTTARNFILPFCIPGFSVLHDSQGKF